MADHQYPLTLRERVSIIFTKSISSRSVALKAIFLMPGLYPDKIT